MLWKNKRKSLSSLFGFLWVTLCQLLWHQESFSEKPRRENLRVVFTSLLQLEKKDQGDKWRVILSVYFSFHSFLNMFFGLDCTHIKHTLTTSNPTVSPIVVSVSKALWQTKPLYHSAAWIGQHELLSKSHFLLTLLSVTDTLKAHIFAIGLILIILASPQSFHLLDSLFSFPSFTKISHLYLIIFTFLAYFICSPSFHAPPPLISHCP